MSRPLVSPKSDGNELHQDVLSVMAGDIKGFARIVKRCQHDVFLRCMWYLGDREQATEASQEVFLRLHQAIVGGDFAEGEHNILAWLRRVAVHISIDLQRSASARLRKWQRFFLLQKTPPVTLPALLRVELQETFQALYQLNEMQRTALVMRVFEELSNAEIGEILGKSEKSVEQLLVRARRNLRRLAKEE